MTTFGEPRQHRARPSTRRLGTVIALATLGLVAVGALPTAATAATATLAPAPTSAPTAAGAGPVDAAPAALPRPMRGRAAVRALGGRLRDVAALNRRTPEALTRVLADDPTMWLDTTGHLFVRDQAAPTADAADAADAAGAAAPSGQTASAAAAYPLDQTFRLHSLPGSHHTVLLDFDGVTLAPTNGWVTAPNDHVAAGPEPGWDPAGDTPTFDDRELSAIQEIWARVAEHYAPFDVDVTTEDPGVAALVRSAPGDHDFGVRIAVTSSSSVMTALCGGACGGKAWVGTTGRVAGSEDYGIGWVFGAGLSEQTRAVAEAAAHEAGHTLGLEHDGNADDDYDEGHAGWAPIMGASYYQDVSQWSKGDYAGANNHQDDVAIIATTLGLRADEAGGTVATAGRAPSGAAYISSRTDLDYYGLGTCSGAVSVVASPASVAADLDIVLTVVDAAGMPVASAAPAMSQRTVSATDPWTGRLTSRRQTSGLGASVTVALPEGTYYVAVDGGGGEAGGAGDPVKDYDDYGSLGAYSLAVSGCSEVFTPAAPLETPAVQATGPVTTGTTTTAGTGLPSAPRAATARPGRRGGVTTVVITWRPPALADARALTGYEVLVVRLRRGHATVVRHLVLPTARRVAEVRLPRRRGVTYAAVVRAHSLGGWGALSLRSRAVSPR